MVAFFARCQSEKDMRFSNVVSDLMATVANEAALFLTSGSHSDNSLMPCTVVSTSEGH